MCCVFEVVCQIFVGDILVGVVFYDVAGNEFFIGVNCWEQCGDFIVYVEVEVICVVVVKYGNGWCLEGCEIVVIFELCVMCVGVIQGVCVVFVVFGVFELKMGVCGLFVDVLCVFGFLYVFEVCVGVCEEECVGLLIGFFGELC